MIRQFQLRIPLIVRHALVVASACLALATPSLAADSAPCSSNPASRALDFWLGHWTISAENSGPVSTSTVSLDLDKCIVNERWDGGRGQIGENIFGYSAGDQSWHGFFADNQGHVHVFIEGKVAHGSAQFTGPSLGDHGEAILNRITIRRIGSTLVQQTWEKSSDGGKTWNALFHLDYKRQP